MPIEVPIDEKRRLEALRRLQVLDTGPEPVFDALVDVAAEICGVPIALISLVDEERQWFKANVGLPGITETPRDIAFCDHVIRGGQPMVVEDATRDARFADNPFVTGDANVRFYAGAPIVLADGERIGTVCVIDNTPRHLDERQLATLRRLSQAAAAALAERARHVATTAELAASEAKYRAIVEDQQEMISVSGLDGRLSFVNGAYAAHFGLRPEEMLGRSLYDFVDADDRETVRGHLGRVLADGIAASNTNRMLSARGEVRWVAWTNRALRQPDGRIDALQSIGRDITEQRAAELALAQSEQRYRGLYEASPAVLHSIDAQGRLLDVSDRWLRMMGYERREVIGRPSSDFLTPASQQKARDVVLPAFFASGACERVDYQFVHKDGTVLDVLLSAKLERDAHGQPHRSLAALEDVSENRRLNAELGRTHAQLDAIVDNVPAMLGYWDQARQTRFANREFQAAAGLPAEQIVGRTLRQVYEVLDPIAYDAMLPHVEHVLRGQRQEFELAMLTTDGLRQLRVTLVPDQPEAGVVAGFFGMAYDITGRKTLELRLKDSEQRYRSLFDHLNSGFSLCEVVVDAAGTPVDYRFLVLNQTFADMVGLPVATTIGRSVTELVPGIERDPADWIGRFGQVALSGEPAHFEERSERLDRWFEIVAYRPAPGQFAVITQDVTQRKRAEQQLQGALQEKETLLKEVYHRVKNNLQVVQSLLNLQQRTLPAGPGRAAIEDSVRRIRAMALVHEKLYQSGSLSAVSLRDYLNDLLKQISDASGGARRSVQLVLDVDDTAVGLDNAIPLGLLVAELVGNSFKHGFADGAGGSIHVLLHLREDDARLAVRDTGSGLPPGFSVERSSSMGLQLAANLARQLGGVLDAVRPGEGGAEFSTALTRLVPKQAVVAVTADGGRR